MSDQRRTTPRPEQPEQVERAKEIRETIEKAKRGVIAPQNPRSFTDQAAAEAARKAKRSKG